MVELKVCYSVHKQLFVESLFKKLFDNTTLKLINFCSISEKRLDKLKRKMHLGKKKNKDAMSLASVSLSRKSSFSSVTSALAFSSPSPNQMRRND